MNEFVRNPENTPPEYLIHGDSASKEEKEEEDESGSGSGSGNAGRLWVLALGVIYCLTGPSTSKREPYQDVMEEVECPYHVTKILGGVYAHDDYSEIRAAIRANSRLEQDWCDALFRYFVLFGWPRDLHSDTRSRRRSIPTNKVYSAVQLAVLGDEATNKRFEGWRNTYSLERGTDPRIQRVRSKLLEIPGAMDLMKDLTAYEPTRRRRAARTNPKLLAQFERWAWSSESALLLCGRPGVAIDTV
jgi:hypothetical protein